MKKNDRKNHTTDRRQEKDSGISRVTGDESMVLEKLTMPMKSGLQQQHNLMNNDKKYQNTTSACGLNKKWGRISIGGSKHSTSISNMPGG